MELCRITSLPGDRESPRLVCIPGGPGLSSQTLRIRLLAAHARRLMVDPPGTGRLTRPTVPKDGAAAYDWLNVPICKEIMRCVGERPFFLLGHSHGGVQALDCAGYFQERGLDVRGVIVIASPLNKTLWDELLSSVDKRARADQNFDRCRKEYKQARTLESYRAL